MKALASLLICTSPALQVTSLSPLPPPHSAAHVHVRAALQREELQLVQPQQCCSVQHCAECVVPQAARNALHGHGLQIWQGVLLRQLAGFQQRPNPQIVCSRQAVCSAVRILLLGCAQPFRSSVGCRILAACLQQRRATWEA